MIYLVNKQGLVVGQFSDPEAAAKFARYLMQTGREVTIKEVAT